MATGSILMLHSGRLWYLRRGADVKEGGIAKILQAQTIPNLKLRRSCANYRLAFGPDSYSRRNLSK